MTTLFNKQASLRNSIAALLQQVNPEKSASANSEPANIGGATTHPSKNVDDGTAPAQEGARSSENEKDNKDDQPIGVNNAKENTPGTQDQFQMNIGATVAATGEDPSNETSSAKSEKDDPGSSHPARTDNSSLDGKKFAELRTLINQANAQGTSILAKLAVAFDSSNKEAQKPAQPSKAASQAGAALAQAVVGAAANDKQAEVAGVVTSLRDTILIADEAATKLADYYDAFFAQAQKQAEECEDSEEEDPKPPKEETESSEPSMTEDPAAEAPMGDMPGAAPAGMAGGGDEIPPELLLQLLQGAGGAGGGGAPPMGEPPMGAGPEGMPPMGDVGGDAALAGMAGGEGQQADLLAMLQEALSQANVDPAAVQAKAAAKLVQMANKQASAKPKWQPKNAAQAQQFQAILKSITDLCGK